MKRLVVATFLFILALIPASLIVIFSYLCQATNTSLTYFPQTLISALRQPSLAPGFKFIMLGVDPRDDQLEKTQVSDSIVVGQITPSWQIKLISIPRDLWIYSLNAKVNQIYPLSRSHVTSSAGYQFIQDKFSQLTGQAIIRTLILTTDNLIELTKIIGGVDVVQDSTYTDKQYPNPEYVNHPSPDIPVYVTVTFPQGKLHLDESNITQYVRSRKGQNQDSSGSGDLGRIQRQQILLEALISKLRSPDFIGNPRILLSLYNFWHQRIETNISDQDIISLLLAGQRRLFNLSLTKTNIPVAEYPQKAVLYHPKTFINQQWVYIPADKDYRGLQQYISDFLNQ